MAMGAATATTTNGDASPVDMPGRRLYANGAEEKNGASHHHKHQHSSEDDDGPDDDSVMTPSMVITDVEYNSSTLQGLSKLRKNRQFCDVILQVISLVLIYWFLFFFLVASTFERTWRAQVESSFVYTTCLPFVFLPDATLSARVHVSRTGEVRGLFLDVAPSVLTVRKGTIRCSAIFFVLDFWY